jgi:hypothetical protein
MKNKLVEEAPYHPGYEDVGFEPKKLKATKKTTVEEVQLISVKITKENKDGSADAVVHFNKKGLETLVQWGMVSMLAAAVDAYAPKTKKSSRVVAKRTKK